MAGNVRPTDEAQGHPFPQGGAGRGVGGGGGRKEGEEGEGDMSVLLLRAASKGLLQSKGQAQECQQCLHSQEGSKALPLKKENLPSSE